MNKTCVQEYLLEHTFLHAPQKYEVMLNSGLREKSTMKTGLWFTFIKKDTSSITMNTMGKSQFATIVWLQDTDTN